MHFNHLTHQEIEQAEQTQHVLTSDSDARFRAGKPERDISEMTLGNGSRSRQFSLSVSPGPGLIQQRRHHGTHVGNKDKLVRLVNRAQQIRGAARGCGLNQAIQKTAIDAGTVEIR